MYSERLGMGTTLPCRGRLQLSGKALHARQSVGKQDNKRISVSAVASPPHKYAKHHDRSSAADSAAPSFTYDSVKLSAVPRAGQPGNSGDNHRNMQAHASNQQSLNIGSLWGSYQRSVETNPLVTKACTSFFGFVIGDVLAQRLTGSTFSVLRCLRLGTYGLTLDGPLGHLWYQVLDKTVWPNDSQSNKAVLAKTAADQLVWAPIMTCVFFAVLKTLEGHPELIMQTIQDKLVRTVVANYVLWPAAHFINFKFVPGQHRVLYNNCVSIVWTLYLSCLAHAPVIDTDEMLGVIDQASFLTAGILEQALPESWADELSAAFNSLLPDLRLEFPKQIPIVPPNAQFFNR
ncbi:TPA: hypothetical protein ACH3X1_013826 [Trebouxia sp. C0004]